MLPSSLSSTLTLTATLIMRLLREGMVLRALVWPGMLCSLALVGTAAGYAMWGSSPRVLVSERELVKPFEKAGFTVIVNDDPQAELISGGAIRGVWKENGQYVLGLVWGGRGSFQIESVLRDFAGDRWRLVIPELEGRPTDVDRQASLMAGIIGLFFTLYGVVIGAGSVFRDRATGCLEGELSLPLPFWVHGAARLLALAVVVAPSLATTLLLLHALLGIDDVGVWIVHGTVAAASGGAIGLAIGSGSRRDRGFSAPLSRALTASMLLLALGWTLPLAGSWLPLASLGAFMQGTSPQVTAVVGGVLVLVLATWRFQRVEALG